MTAPTPPRTVQGGRRIVAQFQKSAGGRLTLFSLTTIENKTDSADRQYSYRSEYDVDHSRKYGYIFHYSGGGGGEPVDVDGIYFATEGLDCKESPCTLVDARDKPPWRGRHTKAIRLRNRTRRLRALPKSFNLGTGQDLLDWLQRNAIDQDSVFCSECRDMLPGDELCKHCWWCDKTGWYSTPSERCQCATREECSE